MSLEKISAQLNTHQKALPPVELWNPPYCGEIDIEIKANGDWFYEGTLFKRLALVKLFASVLIRENSADGDNYFLITPVEKVKIKVEETPFVLTQWHWASDKSAIVVQTNLADEFILNQQHPLTVTPEGDFYVTVRRNLMAKVHRNVYYQWVEAATEKTTGEGVELVLTSQECQFSLGFVE